MWATPSAAGATSRSRPAGRWAGTPRSARGRWPGCGQGSRTPSEPPSEAVMRIAVLASMLPPDTSGGAEPYVQALAEGLAARHEGSVLTTSGGAQVAGAEVREL